MPCAIGRAGWASPRPAPTRVRSISRAMCSTRPACGPRPRRAAAPASKSACFPPDAVRRRIRHPRSQRPSQLQQSRSQPASPGDGLSSRRRWRAARASYAPVEALACRTACRRRHRAYRQGDDLRAASWCSPRATNCPKAFRARATGSPRPGPSPRAPSRARLWPGHGFIWEASDPYLYLRVGPDGRDHLRRRRRDVQRRRDARRPQRGSKIAAIEASWPSSLPHVDARADYGWCGNFGSLRPPARRRSGRCRA